MLVIMRTLLKLQPQATNSTAHEVSKLCSACMGSLSSSHLQLVIFWTPKFLMHTISNHRMSVASAGQAVARFKMIWKMMMLLLHCFQGQACPHSRRYPEVITIGCLSDFCFTWCVLISVADEKRLQLHREWQNTWNIFKLSY